MNAHFHTLGNFGKLPALILLSTCFFLFSGSPLSAEAKADTAFSVSFRVNMSKAVSQNIFDPETDLVYIVCDQGIGANVMVPSPDEVYTITLPALDSGVTVHYKFRINNDTPEVLTRSVTPVNRHTTIDAWWNNIPLNLTIFTVNMTYAAKAGLLNPAVDSVMVAGTMNSWTPVKMQRVDTTLKYQIGVPLDTGDIVEYKYRINAGSLKEELAGQPNRMIRVRDSILRISNFFNNINPAWLPMTFKADLSYYVDSHQFSPENDFVDVAGPFNNNGGNDVLFDVDGDTVYTLTTFIDTSYIRRDSLKFKYRINGSWQSAELQGKPYRYYPFHDTLTGPPNVSLEWYNNLNPNIPTPPWVTNVAVQGHLINHKILSGTYTYWNVNGIPEGISQYQWFKSIDSLGTNITPIDTAWRITYTVDTTDIGKWLFFRIIPKAAGGDSATGKSVMVRAGKVGGVGIDETLEYAVRIYPNPVSEMFTIETMAPVKLIEICDLTGRTVFSLSPEPALVTRLNATLLPAGFYILKVSDVRNGKGVAKFLKQ